MDSLKNEYEQNRWSHFREKKSVRSVLIFTAITTILLQFGLVDHVRVVGVPKFRSFPIIYIMNPLRAKFHGPSAPHHITPLSFVAPAEIQVLEAPQRAK